MGLSPSKLLLGAADANVELLLGCSDDLWMEWAIDNEERPIPAHAPLPSPAPPAPELRLRRGGGAAAVTRPRGQVYVNKVEPRSLPAITRSQSGKL